MTSAGSTYSPGVWYSLVSPSLAVFTDPGVPGGRLDALWDVLLGEQGADAALAVIASGGPAELPWFGLAAVEPDGVRVVVRGELELTVQDEDGAERAVSGLGAVPWRDLSVGKPLAVWFARPGSSRDGIALPVVCGAVLADVLAWQPGPLPVVPPPSEEPRLPVAPSTPAGSAPAEPRPASKAALPPVLARRVEGDHDGRTRLITDPAADPDAPVSGSGGRVGLLHFSTGEVVDVGGPVVVGRAPAQTRDGETARLVAVRGPGRGISRTHVRVFVQAGQVHVEDLGSRNGTLVRAPKGPQVNLKPGVPITLADGAVVTMAEVSFEYRALVDRD